MSEPELNAQALRVGDTVYVGEAIEYPPVPSFAPEHFAIARVKDTGRFKQFRKAIAQLDRKSTRLNSSHSQQSRMPSSA